VESFKLPRLALNLGAADGKMLPALAAHCSCNAKLEMWECHAEGSAAVKQHEFGWAKSG